MKIYYGEKLEDIKGQVPQGTIVFEDRFKKFTYAQYAECWQQLTGINNVICKTRDAILTSPDSAEVWRVDRSVRTSDKGAIVLIQVERDLFDVIL